MKRLSIVFVSVILTFSLSSTSCKKEEKEEEKGFAIETNDWGNLTLTLKEGTIENVWTFTTKGATGKATLKDVGDFTYTYSKDGANSSTLIFDVQGKDKFEMTWTSETAGTFKESFNGTPGTTGNFTIVKN